MPSITIPGIVLLNQNYRDNDRMLTLLSPHMGRVDVLARGCRRPKSLLLPASELFATGEFLLYANKDRYTLTSCTIHDSFYPIRLDYETLNFGVFFLNLAQAAAHPNEPCEAIFTLLLHALNHLTYRKSDLHATSTAFMLHYIIALGYKPRLKHCVSCLKTACHDAHVFFDVRQGGIICESCRHDAALPISKEQLSWLTAVNSSGFDGFAVQSHADAPFSLMLDYVLEKVDQPIKSVHLISADKHMC